jgi:hypothetical protein
MTFDGKDLTMADSDLSPPVGASVWERKLFDHLVGHGRREGALLEQYRQAADETDSKAFAYLVNLLIEDEQRHHGLFTALASSLKTEAELRPEEPEVPYMDFERADRRRVRELTKQMLDSEAEDAERLKRLHKELHDVRDTTLWDLLVGLMRRDTDKHIAILEFVLHHTPEPER